MYLPAYFEERDPQWALAFIRQVRAGTLVTRGAAQLHASLLPWHLSEDGKTLRGHLARANPQATDLERCAVGTAREALVIFQGAHGYVSPSFYLSKAEHHRVVPTWNYEMVQVRGGVVLHDDEAWLREFLPLLTDLHERARPTPWRMSDAPQEYIDALIKAIVGVEIAIERIEAKRKLSQNKSQADRWGVIAGLRDDGEQALAQAMESVDQ